jgi:hypothetical protein
MSSYVALHEKIYLGPLDLTGLARSVSFGPLQCQMQPSTTYGDGGWQCVLPGLISGSAQIQANQDQADGVLDAALGQVGTQYTLTVVPCPTGTVTVADPCWIARGNLGEYNPLDGAVGDVAGAGLTLPYNWVTARALVAHPLGERTSDGNGTAVALTGPTATQRLYAALHVVAYDGFTNVVFKVQSDDNSGFSSATDRITFSTVTGVTDEFASVSGDLSTETHWRVTWDVTGSGSVSFVAAFGVV